VTDNKRCGLDLQIYDVSDNNGYGEASLVSLKQTIQFQLLIGRKLGLRNAAVGEHSPMPPEELRRGGDGAG
jgi:hypothetical protein